MKDLFSSRQKIIWQDILAWIGLLFFIVVIIGFIFYPISAANHPPCIFTHKTSFVSSMTDQESRILTVTVTGKKGICNIQVQLAITNFDISPSTNIQQITVGLDQTKQIIWILHPKSQGTFSYAISFPGSQISGNDESTIAVTNDVGFSAWFTNTFFPAAIFALGPMLTIPYWISLYSEWAKTRKKKRKPAVVKTPKKRRKRRFPY